MTDNVDISGILEAQQENNKVIHALEPASDFGKAIKHVVIAATRFMATITHVDTGSLKASERMLVKALRGEIFIDPNAVNPVSGERPAEYGIYENERGGEHAFFDRTVEASPRFVEQAAGMLVRAIR